VSLAPCDNATASTGLSILANRLAKQNITVILLDRYLEVARGDIHA
jgi:choline dehydrogenase-like flavoprotein